MGRSPADVLSLAGAGGACVFLMSLAAPGEARAQALPTATADVTPTPPADMAERLARLEALVADQQKRIEAQDALLAQYALEEASIEERWRYAQDRTAAASLSGAALADLRGGQASPPSGQSTSVPPPAPSSSPPAQVGQAPEVPPPGELLREQVAAIPEGIAVLSRPGKLTLDTSGEYTRSSANRLVFRGIEIVPGIQIGVIEANEADRDTLAANFALRYGLTRRLEAEVRAAYVRRDDVITTVQQRDEAVTRTIDLEGDGVGDVEASLRYQINGGERGRPIFIAGLRVKSDTGEGPFDIPRDEFGVASRLATGSGFWGIEPSLSLLYPTDPAVIFASLGYFAHLPRDVNRQEGEVLIGEVDPGDAINLSVGFGFSLNPRFSYSLGYKHSYIRPTSSELNDIVEKSDELQVGALTFGMSFQFTDRLSLNGNFEFGVTEDAPDMRFVLRIPWTF